MGRRADRRVGRRGRGSSRDEEHFAGSRPGQEETIPEEDIPYRIPRGLGDLEGPGGLEDRAGPSLVVGREGTCWDFGSQERLEDLEGSGHLDLGRGEIATGHSGLASATRARSCVAQWGGW